MNFPHLGFIDQKRAAFDILITSFVEKQTQQLVNFSFKVERTDTVMNLCLKHLTQNNCHCRRQWFVLIEFFSHIFGTQKVNMIGITRKERMKFFNR